MSKIGVLMVHTPCGHSGYHVMEQIKGSEAREVYAEMEKLPCPNCLKGLPPRDSKAEVIAEIQKAVIEVIQSGPDIRPKVTKHRQVQIRRSR